jgi:hypothetical protein
MKRVIFLIAGLLFASKIIPQTPFPVFTSFSIAHTSVSDTSNWSSFQNPACLANVSHPELLFQSQSRYDVTFPGTNSLNIAYPFEYLNAGISIHYSGFSVWHEFFTGLAFARNFSGKFSLGLQFDLYSVFSYPSNRYFHALLAQGGLTLPLSKNFILGFHSFNIFNMKVKAEMTEIKIPSVFSLGGSWMISQDVSWRFQADKEIGSNYRFATGFDCYLGRNFLFQLGLYGYEYFVPCLGAGFAIKSYKFNLMTELHPQLGLVTSAGIQLSVL